jgi:Cft2 family RNA processing exonuclease
MLEVGHERLLIDCGLFQEKRKDAFKLNQSPEFDVPRYSTHATRDLATFMLRDSAHIQRRDAEYVIKK